MVDAHCHLDLYPNPLSIADECERLGIYTLSMTNLPSHFKMGYSHLKGFKRVRLALGMHPLYSDRHSNELRLFSECVHQTSYIGEIGLDFSKEGINNKVQQVNSFKYVLNAIAGRNKIVSLHSRGAEETVLNYLKEYDIKTAIFHWYTGPVDLINDIVKAGFMFSVNPAMTKSKSGQNIIKAIPLTHLLTESDGPFVQYKGRMIRPADISEVEEIIGSYHQLSRAIISETIERNFKMLISSIIKN